MKTCVRTHNCPWLLQKTPAGTFTQVAFASVPWAHAAWVSWEPPSWCHSWSALLGKRRLAVAGSPSTLADGSTRHSSLHRVIIHPLRQHLQQRFRLAHKDHFSIISLAFCNYSMLQQVSFGASSTMNWSITMKAILSVKLTYQNKSQCIFWWFLHGSVLEQMLRIPLTSSTRFSLSQGTAVILGQCQVNDDLGSREWVSCRSPNRKCHTTAPSLQATSGVVPESLSPLLLTSR